MPRIQNPNTPNMTKCAWPTTQSEKWMICWADNVTCTAHWKQVMM